MPSVASHPSAISPHAHLPKVRDHAEADNRQGASPFEQLLDGVGATSDAAQPQPAERSRKAERHHSEAGRDRPIDPDAPAMAQADKGAGDANTEPSDIAAADGEADPVNVESVKEAKDRHGTLHVTLTIPGDASIEATPIIKVGVKLEPKPCTKPELVDTAIDVDDVATDADVDPAPDTKAVAAVALKLALELASVPVPAPVQDVASAGAPAPSAIPAELPAVPVGSPAIPAAFPTASASASSPAIPTALPAAVPLANDAVTAPGISVDVKALAALAGADKHAAGNDGPLRPRAAAPIADAMPTKAAEREAASSKDVAPRDVDADKPATNLKLGAQAQVGKTDNETPQHVGADPTPATATKIAIDAPQDLADPTQPAQTAANAAAISAPPAATSLAAPPQAQPQPVAVPVAGLAVEIVAQAHAGKQRFEIRLDPPELGRIDVRLDVDRHGHVTSRLVVERAETLDLLKRDASELQRALQHAGLKTSDNTLQFSLRQQFIHDDTGAQHAARVIVPEDDPAPLEALRYGYGRLLGLGGGLDIRV